MRHLISFTLFAAVAALLIVQQDIDAPLMSNFLGVKIAIVLCLAGAIWSAAGVLRLTITQEA